MSLSITRKIDGMKVKIHFGAKAYGGTDIQGQVAPFVSDFHSVSFNVGGSAGKTDGIPHYRVGSGGNSFTGVDADRMLEANILALKIAKQYAGMASDLTRGSDAAYAFQSALKDGDIEEAHILACVIPDVSTKIGDRENWNYRKAENDATVVQAVVRMPEFDAIIKQLEKDLAMTVQSDDFSPEGAFAYSLIERTRMDEDVFRSPEKDMSMRVEGKLLAAIRAIRSGKQPKDITQEDIWGTVEA